MIRFFKAVALAVLAVGLLVSCAKKTPEEKLRDATEALKKRDPLGAIVLAHEVLRENTTGPIALDARKILYQCYAADNNLREARRTLDDIMNQVGLNTRDGQTAALARISTYEAARQTTDALVQTRAFLDVATTGTPFWTNLMFHYNQNLMQSNQLTTAQTVVKQLLTCKQLDSEAIFEALRRFAVCYATTQSAPSGIAFLKQYLADQPSTNPIVPDGYMILGQLAGRLKQKETQEGYYQEGFKAYELLYNLASGAEDKITVLLRYAGALQFKGEVDKAVTLIQKGIQDFPAAPNRIMLRYQLAEVHMRSEKYDKAIEVCRQIPSDFPNDPQRISAYFGVATCHLRQKKYDEAVKDFQEIMALFPNTRWAVEANNGIRQTEMLRRKAAETSATLAGEKISTGTVKLPPRMGAPIPSVRLSPQGLPVATGDTTATVVRPALPKATGTTSPIIPRR